MEKKYICTSACLLQQENDTKVFGILQGYISLPDYSNIIKLNLKKDKFELKSDMDNMELLLLSTYELEVINNATQYINNSLKVLTSLAKTDSLKDACFVDSIEQVEV